MAIDIKNILEIVQRKIAAVDANTSTSDLDKLLNLAKRVDGALVRTYDSDGSLPDATATNEKMAYISSTRKVKFNNGRWDNIVEPPVPEPVVFSFQGTVEGFLAGGSSSPNYSSAIETISFTSDGNSVATGGTLGIGTRNGIAAFSTTHSYNSGGKIDGDTGGTTQIQKFPFAISTGTSTTTGDLVYQIHSSSGHTDGYTGYVSSGNGPSADNNPISPTYRTDITSFPFASDADATTTGFALTGQRWQTADANSGTYGYAAGGGNTPTNDDTYEKFSFASLANATEVGNLAPAANYAAGLSSETTGYTAGSYTIPSAPLYAITNITSYPFAADVNATYTQDLARAEQEATGNSSTTDGYVSGGRYNQSSENIIQKFSFSNTNTATDIGDLTVAKQYMTGTQI